ncbi:MAG: hypothetical protein OXM61_17380 [Candidatus Poribacteria bacterium]|nr:hypothetical protein [Candidatus Poribacteria bacterium]
MSTETKQTKDELLTSLKFFANANGYILWKSNKHETQGTDEDKQEIAESIALLDELVEDGKITYRRTKANNLSIRLAR